jgi:hypothetical protein
MIDSDDRIGLGPAPWTADEGWPTHGYDGQIRDLDYVDRDPANNIAETGHTREEWLALADAMIQRWTAWRAWVAELPDAQQGERTGP